MSSKLKPHALVFSALLLVELCGCCFETYNDTTWEITNNSGDSISISTSINRRLDGVIIPPDSTVVIIESGFGKRKNFSCADDFNLEYTSVAVSGDKSLSKNLNDNENWLQQSSFSTCEGIHSCSCEIMASDIE